MTPAVSAAPARSTMSIGMSIGAVLAQLRGDFPDVTISKIRFLESEGLVEPERTPSGYRKFLPADVERLRYVLSAQRDQYLPLRVIKEHLDAIDRGLEPPQVRGAGPRAPRAVLTAAGFPDAETFARDPLPLQLSRDELLESAEIAPDLLEQIEAYGLVRASPGRAGSAHYDATALIVARTVAAMNGYGIEPRHLRAFKTAADREVGLVEQVITPLLRQHNPESRGRAEQVSSELAALSVTLHAALVKAALRH